MQIFYVNALFDPTIYLYVITQHICIHIVYYEFWLKKLLTEIFLNQIIFFPYFYKKNDPEPVTEDFFAFIKCVFLYTEFCYQTAAFYV